mgnify:CR=1 FL=1
MLTEVKRLTFRAPSVEKFVLETYNMVSIRRIPRCLDPLHSTQYFLLPLCPHLRLRSVFFSSSLARRSADELRVSRFSFSSSFLSSFFSSFLSSFLSLDFEAGAGFSEAFVEGITGLSVVFDDFALVLGAGFVGLL